MAVVNNVNSVEMPPLWSWSSCLRKQASLGAPNASAQRNEFLLSQE
jgi:hypothetical protein